MKVDENHYRLHWEFFQSINTKADERFFVELQINKLEKRITKGLKEIDFSNDDTHSLKGYLNDEKRKNFFFDRDYKDYLNAKLIELKAKQSLNILPPQPLVKQKPALKIDQIALKYVYKGLQITRKNGNEIAKEYGHNSGEKLFQRFTHFSSLANRKGKPNLCTPKKLDNKIKLIESIIEILPTDKQERAKDEVLILKTIYEAEYQ